LRSSPVSESGSRWKTGGQDRLVIGNTAGTLSVLLQVDRLRIVIGGGESRSNLADFVDRTTLPWDRQVSLLVIPGWDEHHAAGALGLVSRGTADGIIVAGSNPRSPTWFTLADEARRNGIRARYLAGEHSLDITGGVSLRLEDAGSSDGEDQEGVTISLHYHDAEVLIVGAPRSAGGRWADVIQASQDTHVLISMRPPVDRAATSATVAVRSVPIWSTDLTATGAAYVANMTNGSRLTIRLQPEELCLPLGRLSAKREPPEPAAGPSDRAAR
jgi:hypothetical protein